MQAYGIETAHCDMARFGETKTLVVQRFDRKLSAKGDIGCACRRKICARLWENRHLKNMRVMADRA